MDERGTLRPSSPMDFLDWAVTVIGGSPNVEGIDLSEFGQTDQLIAVTAPQSSHEGLIVGRYRSESTGTAITISGLDNRFELSATGRFGAVRYDLEHLSGAIWRAKSANAV